MKHKWFSDIDFNKLLKMEILPPYQPKTDADSFMEDEKDEIITLESSGVSLASLISSQEFSNKLV
jgi:hypothetical protein